jgi:hypothetical protein
MNIALFANFGVFGPLQSLMRWWATSRSSTERAAAPPRRTVQPIAPEFVAPDSRATQSTVSSITVRKPLRVVRVIEAGQARTSVGRMVISGRMADVCAELDRLAAREISCS